LDILEKIDAKQGVFRVAQIDIGNVSHSFLNLLHPSKECEVFPMDLENLLPVNMILDKEAGKLLELKVKTL
jgi:hypothetical protein